MSPIKAAVIPLKRNNEDLVNKASKIKNDLQALGMGRVILENSGNIGKGYRRHDEIGTPICITVDFETIENDTVTIRDRDTMSQKRVSSQDLNLEYKKVFNNAMISDGNGFLGGFTILSSQYDQKLNSFEILAIHYKYLVNNIL